MNILYEPALLEHMRKTGKKNILVELVSINSSDIEISELHVYLVDEKRADYFKEKKGYRGIPTVHGEVLLPRYKLNMEENIIFGLKKVWFIKYMTYQGIKL